MSAAALVNWGDVVVFVKRHHRTVRTRAQLRVEHAFASHLRARGQIVPAVLRSDTGDTLVQEGDFIYEIHQRAVGVDTYRDIPSWFPFLSLDHAQGAGGALAHFHQAAADFAFPARSPGVLMNSVALIASSDPLTELHRLLAARPGLARAVSPRSIVDDFTRVHLPVIAKAAPLLRALPSQWGHGDWHGSNLTWNSTNSSATVAGVLDIGLSNRTLAVLDLGVALERSTIDWLDRAGTGHIRADLDAVDAILDGYEEVRPLRALEAAVLVEILPVIHLEYALSEVEYFAEVTRSKANAELAYDGYFIGHTRWYEGAAGSVLLEHLLGRFRQY